MHIIDVIEYLRNTFVVITGYNNTHALRSGYLRCKIEPYMLIKKKNNRSNLTVFNYKSTTLAKTGKREAYFTSTSSFLILFSINKSLYLSSI